MSAGAKDNAALIEELLRMVDEFLKHMAALEAENQDLRAQLVSTGSEPAIATVEPATVLVVDADATRAKKLTNMLSGSGCQTSVEGNSAGALKRLKQEPFNLVFVESELGSEDGIAFIQQVKEAAPDADCLILVGFTSADKAVQALRLGATDFLIRPVQEDDLRARVSELLQKQRIQKRSREYLADLRDRYETILTTYQKD